MKIFRENNSNRYTRLFWLSFAIVLVLNIFVWLYLNQVEQQFKNQLKERLVDANQMLSRLLLEYNQSGFEISLLVPGEQNSLEYFYYLQQLESIRLNSNLQSILLVSPQGEILVASPEVIARQKMLSMVGNPHFRAALEGRQSVSEPQNIAGNYFMSAFAPLKNLDGFTVAVLVIEARATYFATIDNLKNRLLIFSIINFILILLIAAFLFRTIRRTIRYQTAIKEREHLVQLGTMAASVAHELRNPLNIIEGTNDIIKKKYRQDDDELFDYIPQEIKRLSILIDDFLKFARSPRISPETIHFRALTEQIGLSFSEAERSRFEIKISDNLPGIVSDPNLIKQCLLNVTGNALQATEKGGQVLLEILPQKKHSVKIIVTDQGSGIRQEDLDKIFNPFFTTREQGTGLGLAITKRLISHLQGHISIQSEPGKGTSVVLTIPGLRQEKERK